VSEQNFAGGHSYPTSRRSPRLAAEFVFLLKRQLLRRQ
jgi:hypothetical protein